MNDKHFGGNESGSGLKYSAESLMMGQEEKRESGYKYLEGVLQVQLTA